jgi:membrane protease YdiL (CAAX protease family)
VRPIGLWRSALLFAIPSFVLATILYLGIPLVRAAGIPLWVSVTVQFLLFMGGLALAAWIGARRDRHPGETILQRLRLTQPRWREIGAGLLLGAFMLVTFSMLSFTSSLLRKVIGVPGPAWFSEFLTESHFQGLPLAGNPWPVVLYLIQYIFNVFGEELWWRGYILPRQELALKSKAWIANGVLWALFHWFFYWNVIPLLPGALALAWTTQRTRSTWTSILGHGILNGAGFVQAAILTVKASG